MQTLFKTRVRNYLKVILSITVLANLIATPLQFQTVLAAGTNCVTSSPSGDNSYTIQLCIDAPVDGATITGAQTVSVTPKPFGANPGVAKLIFYLGKVGLPTDYLLTDYATPYSFTLPSTKFVDGTYVLEVEALMKDNHVTPQRSSITINLSNGITTPPVNNNTFTPTTGTTPPAGQPFTLVTAGDGADGATNASNVTNLIQSWTPNLFLYVGDVYEKGTPTEFYNWYGQGSTFYGRFRPITDPVIGNHEYENGVAPGYFDYWDNVKNYYSYDAAGWHFIALNSNCSLNQDCAVGKQQYNWLLNDLNTHHNICTIAYFHHPVFNAGPEGYATSMNDIWKLMEQKGVDIVLTGHDHDYQRWVPLDGNVNNSVLNLNGFGNPSPTGITEFVVGTGGHGVQQFTPLGLTDTRMAVGYDTSPYAFGALRLQLNSNGASFQFINTTGLTLDSGAIPCNGAPTDTITPSTPTNLTTTIHSATQVDLNWTGSTDNVGIAGYDIYRNGSLLTSVGYVTSYSDTNLTMGATYNYQVKARDAAGNTSAFSNTATITMPSVLFSDGFESGNLNAWTLNTNVQITPQDHYAGVFAAQASSNGSGASFLSKALSSSQTDLYYSLRFKINSKSSSTSAYLQRYRGGPNGGTAIAGVFVSGTNRLGYRNDNTGTNNSGLGPLVTLGVWHEIQTHVSINGSSGKIEVWYDGAPVSALTATENFGPNPITRIYAGDSSTSNIFDEVLDEIAVNTSFINTTDSQSPSTPTGLAAIAAAPNSVNLTWNVATDNISVTGYDLYRDSSLVATVGAVTSFTDTPVSPGATYQYRILARDGAGNVSPLSAPASVTTPADTTPPTVAMTAPTSGLTVSGTILVAADANDNVDVDHVDFLINDTVVSTVGEGGPYNFLWDTTTVPDGTVAVITARAVDTSSNITTSSSRSVTVDNAAGDVLPPSVPNKFKAGAAGATRVDLSWVASADNIGVTAYDVYRDGALLASTDGSTTTYSDSNVAQGAIYQYQVQAKDAAGNVSALTAPVSVTIPVPLFTEGFENSLSSWTNSGLVAQQQSVLEGQSAVEALSTAGTTSWAYTTLGKATNDLYARTWFKINSQSTNVNLLRFRSGTTGSTGAILGVFVSNTGRLGITYDAGTGSTTSTAPPIGPGWHSLQAHVYIDPTNSANGQVEVWLDGARIGDISQTQINLGIAAVTRVQLGESSSNRNYDVLFDEVVYDTSFVRLATTPYTTIDSGPFGLTSSNAASFTFSPATGATFACSLDSAAFGSCTSPQSFTALADGVHTFAVRATDSVGNVDPTPASRTWTIDTTAPTVTSTTPVNAGTDVLLTASVNATFSEAMNAASLTTSSFTLAQQSDGTPVSANVTYNAGTNTATLQPVSPLAYSTTYVATLKGGAGGATDAIGNPLAADVSWSFTTVPTDATPPAVSVTSPVDGATVSGTVTLTADATDNVAVDHVDFLVNSTVVGTSTSFPYTINWNAKPPFPNGPATIFAHAVDTSGISADSAAIHVTVANDITSPSIPANLSANAVSGAQVDLSWTASTDDVGVTGYDIFRNGSLLKTVGTVTNYSDKTVSSSLTYQYQIQARDAAGNVSGLSSAVSVTTSAALFTDHFETGDLSSWPTNKGLVAQGQEVYAGLYAARATTSGTATYALTPLSTAQYDLYYDIHFKILTPDPTNSIYLMRFKKADTLSAVGIYVSSTGKLGYRNDIASAGTTSKTASVTLNAWHEVQAHIHIDSAGGMGLVEVWFDGAQVNDLSQAEALSNAPITTLQLGDNAVGSSYDIVFDNVTADLAYINPGDITPPTAPTSLTANASSSTNVDLTWGAASDDFGVTGYELFRNGTNGTLCDGTLLVALGPVTSYSDTTAAPLTTYQYKVCALDAAGNISAASAPASVTTPPDTTPPSVMLTAPVNGALLGKTVTLSANASDDIAVDHVDFLVNGSVVGTDATSPYSVSWNSASIADGSATVVARAVDTANNAAVSTGVTVTIDNTPPDTTITSGPSTSVPTNSITATFSFTATETGSAFACSLDGAAFSACTSPANYSGLANGSHTFQVRATDGAGNTDPSAASWQWTIDTIAPTVANTTPTDRASGISPTTPIVAVFGEAMNPATITPTTFFVKPKGGGGSAVPATVIYDPATKKATLQPTSALSAQTTYNVTVSGSASGVKDLAGNALSSNYTWSFTTGVLDVTPPSVTLTAPANGAKVRGTVTLSANASDNVAVASVSFLVNGSVVGTDTTSPYSISWNSTSVPDGSATIAARAADTSNLTTTTANITVTVDNTSPDTSIISGPTGTVSSTSASFSFSSTPTGATFTCSLDGAAFTTCTSSSSQAYSNLSNGSHTFQVAATYQGSTDPTPASRTWTVDTTGPTASITAPANGAAVTGQVTITASASDSAGVASVAFYVNGQLLATDTSAPFSATWNTNKIAKTTYTIYAIAKDSVGNQTQSGSITVTVK